MPTIKMLDTHMGCDRDPIERQYEKDQIYTVGESLAKSFTDCGMAVYADEIETQEADAAPENKARNLPKRNKK